MTFQSTPITRRNVLRLTALSLAAGVVGCATSPSPTKVAKVPGADQTAAALPMVNALRAKNGLPALHADPAATAAALYQAKRMASAGSMRHLMGVGDNFGDRVKASGVKLPAAENIAAQQSDVGAAVTAWINSPHHLRNMLGNYSGIGVAVAHNPASGDTPYWAMVLSTT